MGNRNRLLIKNMLILGFGTILPKFTSYIILPILTGVLTKAEYGTFDVISTMTSFFLPIATLQTHIGLFRFLIDVREAKNETSKTITNFYLFEIPVSIISILILYVALFKVTFTIRVLICFLYISELHFSCLQQIARGIGKNSYYSIGTIIQAVIQMTLIVYVLKVKNFGLTGALFAFGCAYFIGSVYYMIQLSIPKIIKLQYLDKGLIKEMIGYSWPMIPESLAFWVLSFSDRALLSLFLGVEAVAVYAVASKIPSLLTLFRNVFSYAWQENASLSSKDNDVSQYYSEVFRSFNDLLAGGTAVLISTSWIIYSLLVRGDYSSALLHIPILLTANFFSMIASFLAGVYVAKKATKSIGITTMVAAAINAGIDVLFIKLIGIFAASLSTLIGFAFLALYRMRNIKKIQPIKIDYKRFCIESAFIVLLATISYFSNAYTRIVNILLSIIFAIWINRRIIVKFIRRITPSR